MRCVLLALGLVITACTASGSAPDTSTSTDVPGVVSTTTTSPPVVTTTTSAPSTIPQPELASEMIELGPLAPRGGHSVVWTGREVIVWGGEGSETGQPVFSDGAAFDPATGTWRLLAESPLAPRRYHLAAWTGDEMVIVGGVSTTDAAAYDPDTDSWRVAATPPIPVNGPAGASIEGRVGSVWTGDELIVWLVVSDQLAAYDPRSDTWRLLPPTGLEADDGALRWDGDSVYAFGATVLDYPSTNELEVARLVGDAWERLDPTDFSTDLYTIGATATLTAWAGEGFLAWSDSGRDAKTMFLDPETGTWSRVEDVPSSPCEGQGEPISADGFVFAFGWCGSDVGVYDVGSETWETAVVGGFPKARYTVWTGEQLMNWGDTCCYGSGGKPFTSAAWSYTPPR